VTDPTSAHIVFVNNFAGPGLGGGEVQLLAVVKACVSAGMRVTVVCQRGTDVSEAMRDAGATVAEANLKASAVGAAVSFVRAQAAGADIVQGTGWWTNMLVRMVGPSLPTTAVVNLVQVEPDAARFEGVSRIGLASRRTIDRVTHRHVAAYIAVSNAVADALEDRGVSPDLVRIIPNGVDIATLAAAAAGPPTAGVPEGDGPLVACIARLEKVKGVEHFVRAAALLTNSHPTARFVIAGAGAEESHLREIAVAAKLKGHFAFLGRVSPIEPLLAAATIVAMPSLSEAFGLVAIEAGALGKPVVASSVGGLREVIDNGETGLLVPPADHVALAGAIGTLLHDPQRAVDLGSAARDRVMQHYTLESMTAAHLDLYASLLTTNLTGE